MIRSNPPWTDAAISSYWDAIERRVGPALMPTRRTEPAGASKLQKEITAYERRLEKDGDTHGGWLSAMLREKQAELVKLLKKKPKGFNDFGCGHYGCVLPTNTPGIVMKITSDPTEASFVSSYLSLPPAQRPVGIIPYYQIFHLPQLSKNRRPIFVLWRDEAEWVGDIDGWIRSEARDFEKEYLSRSFRAASRSLTGCLNAGRIIRAAAKGKPLTIFADADKRVEHFWAQLAIPSGNAINKIAWGLGSFQQCAMALQNEPMGSYLGAALQECFNIGLLLADVHFGNIGMPIGELKDEIGHTPIITDPGHAIPLDDRYSGVVIQDI